MSNAICVQGDCTTFLMYDKVGNQLVPFIKELCQEGDGYQVRNFKLDGTDYGDSTEEVFPGDVSFDREVMCGGETTFLRWYASGKGKPLDVTFDTDLDGALIATVGGAKIGHCNANDVCQTERLYEINGQVLTPILRKICPGEAPVYYDIDGTERTAAVSRR